MPQAAPQRYKTLRYKMPQAAAQSLYDLALHDVSSISLALHDLALHDATSSSPSITRSCANIGYYSNLQEIGVSTVTGDANEYYVIVRNSYWVYSDWMHTNV